MANVMVVEDDPIYRDLVHLLCQMDGHRVVDAADAEEALKILDCERASRNFDLFIVDDELGGLAGRDFIERVRERDRFQETPILMLSGAAFGPGESALRRKVEFLRKPMDNTEVVAVIRKLLPPWSPATSAGDWA